MSSPTRFQRLVTLCLAHALTLGPLAMASPARSQDEALFRGKVFDSDRVTPREGLSIALVDATTERVYRSGPSRPDGAFEVHGAPAGSYVVLAETAGGAFKAAEPIELQAGSNEPVALTVDSIAPAQGSPAARSGLPKWGKWTIFGAIAVAALFLVTDAGDNVEENASEF